MILNRYDVSGSGKLSIYLAVQAAKITAQSFCVDETSVTSTKSPNVYKSCPNLITLDFDTFTKIA